MGRPSLIFTHVFMLIPKARITLASVCAGSAANICETMAGSTTAILRLPANPAGRRVIAKLFIQLPRYVE
jgi:hypothetical protein